MFSTLLPNARAFFTDLAANNSRDWFLAHKDSYDAKVATPEDASSAAAPALANASASRPVAAAALRTLRRVSSEDDFRGQTECG